ncbi:MAG TPA: MerR family transcriptional regulator [Chloroflexota bacterium]|jgi:MerR family transcriptional regulator/heat shock protein HspR
MAGRRKRDDGCVAIGMAARLLNVHPQTLRYYERAGLLTPSRSKGRIRLYSADDLQRAQQIKRLIDDLGVNLAGVEVILQLMARLRALEEELERLRRSNEELLQRFRPSLKE